jgi:RNA polymerase primary sigma factor
LAEDVADENESPTDSATRQFLLEQNMESLLDTLEDREKHVLRLYYGIGLETSYTLAEIATSLNLTRERIRQMKEKAIKRLQHPSRSRHLMVFRD